LFRLRDIVLAALLTACLTGPALGFEPVAFEPSRHDGYARIAVVFPDDLGDEALSVDAIVRNQVLIARFSRPLEGNVRPIMDVLGAEAAMARLDPDGRTLRVALRVPAKAHVSRSYNHLAIDLIPEDAEDPPDIVSPRERAEREAARRAAEAPPPPPAAPPVLDVDVARASNANLERITLTWPEPVGHVFERQGNRVRLRFERDADISLGPLRADMPQGLAGISEAHIDDRYILGFELEDGFDVRTRSDGPVTEINISALNSAEQAIAALEQAAQAMNGDAEPDPEAPVIEPVASDEEAPDTDGPVQLLNDQAGESDTPVETLDVETAPDEDTDPSGAESADREDAPEPEPWTDPVPEDGQAPLTAASLGESLTLRFNWRSPVAAAAFQRGEWRWIVFAAGSEVSVDEVLSASRRHVLDAHPVSGEGYSGLRIKAPPATLVTAQSEDGAEWTFALANRMQEPPRPIALRRETSGDGFGMLTAILADGGPVLRVQDPVAGDWITVVPAPPVIRGLAMPRDYLQLKALASAHGLAFALRADDLIVSAGDETVTIERPQGLALTPEHGVRSMFDRRSAATPGFIDFQGWRGPGLYREQRAALERRVAEENDSLAYLDYARFLIGHELSHEALGALRLALERDPTLSTDAPFLALRAAAAYLAGRPEQAEKDLSAPDLARDASSHLWRGLVAMDQQAFEPARQAFDRGREAIYGYPERWRVTFRSAYADAALELNDLATANAQIDLATSEASDRDQVLYLRLQKARLREAQGRADEALEAYQRLSQSGHPQVEAEALLAKISLQMKEGLIGDDQAISELELLRLRWRGDHIELATIRELGQLYVDRGAYRRGLSVMRSALPRFAEQPETRRIATQMSEIFKDLYLEGEADRMDPVEAVALYYEFSELTPINADGDRMIRRLAERLVGFDLLSRASDLLQHQVDNRLREPIARAQVASDLALIYLMDRKPEQALRTLRQTRRARLPDALQSERSLIEARALAELGSYDAALDLLERDRSLEASRIRADIAWRTQSWAEAGQRFEEFLGDFWRSEAALPSSEQESVILRAAVAYSLANDQDALDRLNERYGDLMNRTGSASAFRAVVGRVETEGLALAQIAERVADTSDLETFLESRRSRLEGENGGIDYESDEPQSLASVE